MKITFEFKEPDRLHANSEKLTTAELARILEKKYHLIEKFTKYISDRLKERLMKLVSDMLDANRFDLQKIEVEFNKRLGGWLQNEWREFINTEAHNIKTKAAREANRQSFVNTGDYFKSLIVNIRLK